MRGSVREGFELHLRAERTLGSVGQAERDDRWWGTWIDVELERAHHHYFEDELDDLAIVIAELRPVVDERGTPARRLQLLHVLAQNSYRHEQYVLSEETEALVREIYRLSGEIGDTSAEFTLGFCLLWRGKLEEAETHLRQGLEDARRRGDALIEVRCLVYGALVRRLCSDVEGARALLAELVALDDLLGYVGLASAGNAWVALRDGDHDAASRFAEAALADWDPRSRSGSSTFQWTARFPLLAIELARGEDEAALGHARVMLDVHQHPLPADLATPLAAAVERGDASLLAPALEVAGQRGYA